MTNEQVNFKVAGARRMAAVCRNLDVAMRKLGRNVRSSTSAMSDLGRLAEKAKRRARYERAHGVKGHRRG
ncbi:MAG TPA: hypothetical protein VMF31_10705 [Solirubrobacterales bacterium]|nr:hypothetical protein [Solirubrobacterales bacterium]